MPVIFEGVQYFNLLYAMSGNICSFKFLNFVKCMLIYKPPTSKKDKHACNFAILL